MVRVLAVGVAVVATLSFFGVAGIAGVEVLSLVAASGGVAVKRALPVDEVVVKAKPKKRGLSRQEKGVRNGAGK